MTTLVLLPLLFASPPAIEVSIAAGADSNPYELPADPTAAGSEVEPRSAALVELDARANWRTRAGETLRFSAEGDFEAILFGFVSQDSTASRPARPSDLNRHSGSLALPLQLAPMSRRRAVHIDATLEPFAAMNRETYTSHRTGRSMVIDIDPNPFDERLVDLGRRYDTNEWGAGLEVYASLGRVVDMVLEGRLTQVDYLEDYEEIETVDSLDYRESRGTANLLFRPGNWILATGYTLRRLDYRERFPRDSSGDELDMEDPGYSPQEFTYQHVTAKAGLSGDLGGAVFRWRGTRRLDMYEGYLDYTENKIALDLRLELPRDVQLRFQPTYSDRKYDSLHVRYDPSEPVSSRRRFSAEAHVQWPALSPSIRMFVSGSVVSQESRNALYSYSEARAMTGFLVRAR